MSHRMQPQDIPNVSPLDCCDMELRFTLIAVEAINNEFHAFTPEQGKDLRRLREMADEMLMRVEQ